MYTLDEIRQNLAGAWQVMNGDSNGFARLDTTIEGFWRSFGAIVFLIPVFVLLILSRSQLALELQELAEDDLAVPVQALIWLVEWLLFPIVMALVARPIGVASQYVPFIVARNWASVLVVSFYVIPLLAFLAGIISAEMLIVLQFVVLALSGYFSYRIVRTALAVPPGLAAGIVLADFGLSFMINDLVRGIVG